MNFAKENCLLFSNDVTSMTGSHVDWKAISFEPLEPFCLFRGIAGHFGRMLKTV
jgi:hypothetical protein